MKFDSTKKNSIYTSGDIMYLRMEVGFSAAFWVEMYILRSTKQKLKPSGTGISIMEVFLCTDKQKNTRKLPCSKAKIKNVNIICMKIF